MQRGQSHEEGGIFPGRGRGLAHRTACCALWLFGMPALAADPVVLVGGPPVVADGQNTATVQIWSPAVGESAKISVKGAPLLGEPAVDGGDFVSFRITPPLVTETGELELKVKISSPDGKGKGVVRIPVVPPDRGEIGIAFDPPQFRYGVDNAVSVRITLPVGPRSAGSQSLEVHSSIGVIDTVTAEDGGRSFLARWRPPKSIEGSQMAVFAVVDKAAPDRVVGTAAYPVMVKKSVEMPAAAGSSALLTVGERQFGPLPAGPDGRVRFELERDPRISSGRLRVIGADGSVTESTVELAFGEGPRFTFVPPAVGAVADPSQAVKVTVVAVNPDGTPWVGKAPEVTVDRGSVSAVVAASRAGRFVVTYQPDSAPGKVTFTAALDGRTIARTMNLVPAMQAGARTGALEPVLLEGNKRDATFTVTGAEPGALRVSGGAPRGRLTGNGPYTVSARLNGSASQMVVHAGPESTPTGRPVTKLFMWTSESTVQADAVSMVPFVVAAVDDQGQPVPNVPLSLAVASGSGTLPPMVTTGADGLATGLFTVGNQVGPVTLTAEGSGVRTAAPVFLEGAGYTGAELATTGDTRTLAERDTWIGAVAVARAGRAFPAAQPAVAPMTGADVARLEAERKVQEREARMASMRTAKQPAPDTGERASSSESAAAAPPETAPAKSTKPAKPAQSGGFLDQLGPPPADGLGRSETRVAAHVGAMPRNYLATAVDIESGIGGSAVFETPGMNAPSLDLRGQKWFDAFGADARYRYVYQTLELPFQDDPVQLGGSELLLGGRYRRSIRPGLTWQAAAGFHYQTVSAFVVGTDGFEEARQGLPAARVAGGLVLDRGPYYASFETGGSFKPVPTGFQVELTAGYEVAQNIAIQGMVVASSRAGTVSDDDLELLVVEGFRGFFIGAAYALP
ncbi:MAG: hypothetical protein CL927_02050 [Deltaproteobacteria bacterium]|nr:hypothetical protein [Deltaproteobacteria bacterium]